MGRSTTRESQDRKDRAVGKKRPGSGRENGAPFSERLLSPGGGQFKKKAEGMKDASSQRKKNRGKKKERGFLRPGKEVRTGGVCRTPDVPELTAEARED